MFWSRVFIKVSMVYTHAHKIVAKCTCLLYSHNADQPKSPVDAFLKLLRDLIPDNIAAAATVMNLLGILFFSVCFGAALSVRSSNSGCRQLITSVAALNDGIITMVRAPWQARLSPACISVSLLG